MQLQLKHIKSTSFGFVNLACVSPAPAKAACVEPIYLGQIWAFWRFVIFLFPDSFKWEPLSNSLGFTIDLFLQSNLVYESFTQILGNEDHEEAKGQQMLPRIPLTQEQRKIEATSGGCDFWRRSGYPNSSSVCPFRFYWFLGFDSHFFPKHSSMVPT